MPSKYHTYYVNSFNDIAKKFNPLVMDGSLAMTHRLLYYAYATEDVRTPRFLRHIHSHQIVSVQLDTFRVSPSGHDVFRVYNSYGIMINSMIVLPGAVVSMLMVTPRLLACDLRCYRLAIIPPTALNFPFHLMPASYILLWSMTV